jgi:hypothetical protein
MTTPDSQPQFTQPPEAASWRAGTPLTGPLELVASGEMNRESVKAQLTKVAAEAFTHQFRIYPEKDEAFTSRLAESASDFLTTAIDRIQASQQPQVKKAEMIQAVLSTTIGGEYHSTHEDESKHTKVDMLFSEMFRKVAPERQHPRGTDDVMQGTMFGKRADSPTNRLSRRLGLSRLYLEDPEAVDRLINSDTIGMHGTRSGNLESVLERGLLSGNALNEQGIVPVGAEIIQNDPEGQKSVSLIDWHNFEWLNVYAGDQGPVTYGTVTREIQNLKTIVSYNNEGVDPGTMDDFDVIRNPHLAQAQAKINQLKALRSVLIDPAVPEDRKQRIVANYPVVVGLGGKLLNKLGNDNPPKIPGGDIAGEFVVDTDIQPDLFSMILVPEANLADAQTLADRLGSPVRIDSLEKYRRAFKFLLGQPTEGMDDLIAHSTVLRPV